MNIIIRLSFVIITAIIIASVGVTILDSFSSQLEKESMESGQSLETIKMVQDSMSFFPIIIVITVLGLIVSFVFVAIAPIVDVPQTEEEINNHEPPRKQTYLQYVQERLEVERLLK